MTIFILSFSVFAEDTYKIKYDYGVADIKSENITNNNPHTFTSGQAIQLTPPSCPGFEFKGWYLDASYNEPVSSVDTSVNANIVLYAKWYEMTYNISYIIEKDGFDINTAEVTNNNRTSRLASESTLIIPPVLNKDCYTFDGWYTDPEYKEKITVIDEYTCEDITLFANWINTEYNIHYEMGAISNSVYPVNNPNPDIYIYSEELKLTPPISEDPSYSFDGWYTDEFFTEKTDSIERGISGDVVLYAKWTAKQYKITYKLNENSQIKTEDIHNYNPDTFEANTGVTLAAPITDDKSYEFAGWYTSPDFDKNAAIDSIPSNTNRDITVYAKWETAVYTISYDYGIISQIMLPIENTNPTLYNFGDSFALKTIDAPGFIFNGWCKDPALKEKITDFSAEFYGDITIYADFTEKTYSISYVLDYDTVSASQVVNTNPTVRTTTQRVELENPQTINKDYKFGGWYTDNTYTEKITHISGYTTGNLTLYAKWIKLVVYLPCWGDATLSEQLTASDARLILRYSAGLETGFTELQKKVSDINNDGKVNAIDARITLRLSAGLETEYNLKKQYSLPTIKVVDGEVVFR